MLQLTDYTSCHVTEKYFFIPLSCQITENKNKEQFQSACLYATVIIALSRATRVSKLTLILKNFQQLPLSPMCMSHLSGSIEVDWITY